MHHYARTSRAPVNRKSKISWISFSGTLSGRRRPPLPAPCRPTLTGTLSGRYRHPVGASFVAQLPARPSRCAVVVPRVTGTLSARDRARAEPRQRAPTERVFGGTRVRSRLERCSARSRACSRQQARPNECSTERAARRTSVRQNACSIRPPETIHSLWKKLGITYPQVIPTLWKSCGQRYPQRVENPVENLSTACG